jgi:hypothetical protein
VPSLDGGDDFIRVGRPREWLRIGVCFGDEAVDGRLEIDDGAEDATFQATSADPGKYLRSPWSPPRVGSTLEADGDQSSALIHTILTGIGGMGLASAGQIRIGAPFQIRVLPRLRPRRDERHRI